MRPDPAHRQSPEDRLREALLARVADVEPAPDALPMIRMRTAERRRNAWAMIGVTAAVATAIAIAAVAFVPDRGSEPLPAASQSPAVSSSAPPPVEPAPPSVRPTDRQPATVELPVYFARNGKLVREFHALKLSADGDVGRLTAAVNESLRGNAYDPDYVTLWADGVTVRRVAIDGKTVTVDLADVGGGPRAGTAQLAVQQLVYSVAAASTYTTMKNADGVRILVDGAPVAKLWGAVDTAGPLRQAPQVDVLAPVWVIDPQQNEQVGQTFTVYLAGIVFEGTVNLRIRGTGGAVVKEQVVQLSVGAPALGEARVPVTLAPGKYTVEAYFVSMKDGSVQAVDDHDFTVG